MTTTVPEDGGPAFPAEVGPHGGEVQTGNQQWLVPGMSLRDYAAIKFGAAWAVALGTSNMAETRDQRTNEAARLGLVQADAFLKDRRRLL